MNVSVAPVRSRQDLRRFLLLPWRIYRGDRSWVPPLLADARRRFASHARTEGCPTERLFVAFAGGEAAGRVAAGFDPRLNAAKGTTAGHLSMFESVDRAEVAVALFDAAFEWLAGQGLTFVRGPVSPDGPAADEQKGLLIDGFDRPPVILTSYNPPWYQRLFEAHGFEKDLDLFAYYLDRDALFSRDPARVLTYIERKYGLRVEALRVKRLEDEIRDLKRILDVAIPAEWPDMVPPTLDEMRALARRLAPLADPALTAVVRAGDEPVGFGLALPDYNQVLIHLNGRMTPIALAKYVWYRRHITCARIFIMFVVPAYRAKGVSHAIYYRIFREGVARGYTHGEGSTIGETNTRMRRDVESIGGRRYKTYRVYGREL